MKKIIFLATLLIAGACKTSNGLDTSKSTTSTQNTQNQEDYCPEKGSCSVKLLKNSSMMVKEDTIGKYYPVIEKGDKMIVQFSFVEKGPDGTVDGDYSETIQFELSDTVDKLTIADKELEQVNLLYGKQCFCRGQAGYYKIQQGNLTVEKSKDQIVFELSFTVKETSHKIVRIKETLSI